MDRIAKKAFRYRGRALQPGDTFNPSRAHARVLEATGRLEPVELGTVQVSRPRVRTKGAAKFDNDRDGAVGGSRKVEPSAELTAARAEYTALTGKRFFSGWSLAELRKRMDEFRAANPDKDSDHSPQDTGE